MSQVKSFSLDLSGPFGHFGSTYQYDFNIVYNMENMLEVGINNTNVVIIPGHLTEESIQQLDKLYVNTQKWKESMVSYLQNAKEYHKVIETFFDCLEENFKKQYSQKYPDYKAQINKMKPYK